jgi:hypothetical protein
MLSTRSLAGHGTVIPVIALRRVANAVPRPLDTSAPETDRAGRSTKNPGGVSERRRRGA